MAWATIAQKLVTLLRATYVPALPRIHLLVLWIVVARNFVVLEFDRGLSR